MILPIFLGMDDNLRWKGLETKKTVLTLKTKCHF
jgi:hypothetical protein